MDENFGLVNQGASDETGRSAAAPVEREAEVKPDLVLTLERTIEAPPKTVQFAVPGGATVLFAGGNAYPVHDGVAEVIFAHASIVESQGFSRL